jgi:tripartite-type tricarboxylate transporter receptor subunit TctC
MREDNRRQFIKYAGAGIAMATLAGCMEDEGVDDDDGGNGDDGDFPPNAFTFVSAYSEGGGVDTNFREIQPYFEEEIDANFDIDYQDGAGTRIASTSVAENDDATSILGTLTDGTASALAIDDAEGTETDFQLEDLQPLGTISEEAAVIRVRDDDDRFQTIEELVDYASDNPGELTVGASGPTNRNVLSIIQLMEETDADFTIVPYDGGGPTETGLLQGEVDVAARSVYNSADIEDESTCVAIYAEENPEPELTGDAPPINEALGTDIDYEPSNGIQWYGISAAAADEYPDRYEHIQEALEAAHSNEEYHADLEDINEEGKLFWADPDETMEILETTYDTFYDLYDLFEEYVQE